MTMQKTGKLLVVDDDGDVLLAASMLLKREFASVQTLKDPARIVQLLRKESFDVILLDMNFSEDTTSGREGFFWLNNIKALRPDAVVVMFTAFGGVEMAVRAIKEGAFDFVLKPWHNEKLLATMHAAMRLRSSQAEVENLTKQKQELAAMINPPIEFIGESKAMHHVFQTISKVAATDANILITGENGTGKELVARSIHQRSLRHKQPFVPVDMGSLSGNLFESELFGHVKGAFTDAREDRIGRFEVAGQGSIFLDEIGNLPVVLQSKLLSVLQSRTLVRVGDHKSRKIEARLICATNADLHQCIEQGTFRQDLLYRINTVEIKLPPLRQRPEDIPVLAEFYLNHYADKYRKTIKKPSREVIKALVDQEWPGNVRELQHTLERAVILCEGGSLQPRDVTASVPSLTKDSLVVGNLENIEKRTIELTLNRYRGNISQAAMELGLSRAALYRRMEKYGL